MLGDYGWLTKARYGKPVGKCRMGSGAAASDMQEHHLAGPLLRGFALRSLPGVTTAYADLAHEAFSRQLGRGGRQAGQVAVKVEVALFGLQHAPACRSRCLPPAPNKCGAGMRRFARRCGARSDRGSAVRLA